MNSYPNPARHCGVNGSGLRQCLQVQSPRVLAADHHGEGVVKAERRAYAEAELASVGLLHSSVDFLLVAARLLFENRCERRTRIFRVDIDSSGEDRLLADECAGQVEAAFHGEVSPDFDDLSEQFSQDELLGEVLGTNDNSIRMTFTTDDRKKKREDEQ